MRPLYLSVEGMHSFVERQEIHFTQLSDMGMFGIFGPTGSGKSTILDAITLSLYGRVGRALHGTHGVINHNVDRMEVIYEFELFSAGETRRYRIERRYQRRDDQRAELRVCRLLDITVPEAVSVLGDKVTDVENTVRELIGLTMDDFTKAVVLPQGRFAELLQMKPAERKSMLERLFGLEKYGAKLRSFVGRRLENVRHELDLVQQGLTSLGDASPEALAKTEDELQAARTEESNAKTAADAARIHFHRVDGLWQTQKQLNEIGEKLAAHRLREDDIRMAKAALAASERAQRVLVAAQEGENLASQKAALENRLNLLEQEQRSWNERRQGATGALEQAQARYAEEQPRLVAQQAKLEEARAIDDEARGARERLQPLQERAKKLEQEVQASAVKEKTLSTRFTKAKAELDEASELWRSNLVDAAERMRVAKLKSKTDLMTAAHLQWQQQRREAARRHASYNEAAAALQLKQGALTQTRASLTALEHEFDLWVRSKPGDEEVLSQRDRELERIHHTLELVQQAESQVSQAVKQEFEVEERLDAALQQLETADSARAQAVESVQRLEATQQKELERLRQNHAAMLAAELVAGEPCPVCGSTVHPRLGHADLSRDAAAAQQEAAAGVSGTAEPPDLERKLAQARDFAHHCDLDLSKATHEVTVLRVHGQAAKEQVLKAQDNLKELVAKVNRLVAEDLPEGLPGDATGDLPVSDEPDGGLTLTTGSRLSQWLEIHETDLTQQKKRLQDWTNKHEDLRAKIDEARQRLGTADSEASAAQVRAELSQREESDAEVALSQQRDVLREAMENLRQELASLSVSLPNLLEDAPKWIAAAQQEIQRKDQLAQEAQRRTQELETGLKDLENQILQVKEQKMSFESDLAKLMEQWRTDERWIQDLEKRVYAVTGGDSVARALEGVKVRLNQLLNQRTEAEQAYRAAEQKLLQTTEELTIQRTRLGNVQEMYATFEAKIERLLSEEGFVTIQAARDAKLTDGEQESLENSVSNYEETTRQFESRLQHLRDQLGNQFVSEHDWEQAKAAEEQAQALWQTALESRAGLENNLKELQVRHERWKVLNEQVVQLQEKEQLVKEIASLLQGNAFVGFLAAEHMDFVAHAASDLFQKLSSNKFALEVDSEGGFLVRDDFNAGKRRAVGSLSGGELFQASLSLALALSTQIQLRGSCPLEFFFLDEGFGTLDPERLDKVMTSLETLQHGSMTIGIISHVPELRQRMPRRLLIEPADASGRGSRVRIERL